MSVSMMGPLALHGIVGGRETGWVIVNPSADGSFDVSTEDTAPEEVAFRDDGTRMYVLGDQNDSVYQYDLSTAWDVTSATLNGSFDVSTEDTDPKGIAFRDDGTRMFVAGQQNTDVYQYDLSTAWDVTTASLNGSFDVSTEDTGPQAVDFQSDGTRMFVAGTQNDSVYQYDLSTAWDVTTASAAGSFDISTQSAGSYGLRFSKDGDRMFVAGSGSEAVHQYSLSTAWDVSTASVDGRFVVSDEDTMPLGLAFSGSGRRMFVVGQGTDAVYQYERV